MFLLIRLSYQIWLCQEVSIHLMFLLIFVTVFINHDWCSFNTSHVSINRLVRGGNEILTNVSIHLMFLLINRSNKGTWEQSKVSIHLMFLLISTLSIMDRRCFKVSIHLMFLLIFLALIVRSLVITFQYISCFY